MHNHTAHQIILLDQISQAMLTLDQLLPDLNLTALSAQQRNGLHSALDRLQAQIRLVHLRNTQPQPTASNAS